MTERTRTSKTLVECVDCGAEITLTGQVRLGQEVTCPECSTMLEVVGLDPVEVDWIYDEPEYDDEEEEEDW